MEILQHHWVNQQWHPRLPAVSGAQLVLLFGDRNVATDEQARKAIQTAFPRAEVVGCTTSGEILGRRIFDETLVLTAIEFAQTEVVANSFNLSDFNRSFDLGLTLAKSFSEEDLRYLLVFSDGQLINGTELVDGLTQGLANKVPVSGGLAGDGTRFEETIVWHNERQESGLVVAVGLYGSAIRCGHGTLGGWDAFGPERLVTRASGNLLFELDGQPALELYKKYLGDYSAELPSSALLFPLHVTMPGEKNAVVRTILNIDETAQSMTFAGDIPEGSKAQLMRANFERLVDGAQGAAETALSDLSAAGGDTDLALLISCVGRRLLMGPRTEDELEAVASVVGEHTPLCGFYSFGEISPLIEKTECRLHNQTMTITTFTEVCG